jgi:hypothetical protein
MKTLQSIYRKMVYLAVVFMCPLIVKAQMPTVKGQTLMKGLNTGFCFTENRGQLADEKGILLQDIFYYGQRNGVNIYCKNNKLSFVFTKIESKNNSEPGSSISDIKNKTVLNQQLIATSRMDMDFVGANPTPQIISENAVRTFANYYLAHTPEAGITNIKSYQKLIYKDIYPNIDLVLEANAGIDQNLQPSRCNSQFEYSFIIHPGGNPYSIVMHWSGNFTGNKILKNGGLYRNNRLGEMFESRPIAYQPELSQSGLEIMDIHSKGSFTDYIHAMRDTTIVKSIYLEHSPRIKPVLCAFTFFDDNSHTLAIGNYDGTKDLIIDPTLSWGTYYGGDDGDLSYGIATDISGNTYITGYTSSTSGIATTGAYQSSRNSGNQDAFLAKFNSSDSLQWATYYGGSNNDNGTAVCTDSIGNPYMAGLTYSFSGIATSGAYQDSNASPLGNRDAFLAKFNSDGKRQWGTYYGGYDMDEAKAISADRSGNVYITGNTASTSGIATSSAFQTDIGGSNDAFLARFNSTGKLSWATYYGESGYDNAYGVSADDSGNIYITGGTTSTAGIATSGAYKTSFAGGYFDAFLAKFNSSGKLSWATYYGGKNDEEGYSVKAHGNISNDDPGYVYITGYTFSTKGIATPGAFQTTYEGSSDAFLARFSNSGALQWSTYYGGNSGDVGYGVSIDNSSNVYITGETSSSSKIATSGAYQTSIAGLSDVFIAKFSGSGSRVWSSYYGGIFDDIATGLTVDGLGGIYISGFTISSSGISTTGAYQTSKSSSYDVFLAKFSGLNTAEETEEIKKPDDFKIYPNPFTDQLSLQYNLKSASHVKIIIYSVEGREITTLADQRQDAGIHQFSYVSKDYNTTHGIYFMKLVTDDKIIIKQIIQIK